MKDLYGLEYLDCQLFWALDLDIVLGNSEKLYNLDRQ